jgi:hypothetical protein
MIAYSGPVTGFMAGQLEPHPDDPSMVLIRKPNGMIVSISPEGVVDERQHGDAGPWESFRKSGSRLLAERDGSRVYVLAIVE